MNFWYIGGIIWFAGFIFSIFSQNWLAVIPNGWLAVLSFSIGAGKINEN